MIPAKLKIVAWLFLLSGAASLIGMLLALIAARISIDFGVLGLPIGWGLLRLSPGWRTLALVFIVLALVGLPIIGLIFLSAGGPISLSILGVPATQMSKELGLLFVIVAWVLCLWQYRVLTSEDVRLLFNRQPAG